MLKSWRFIILISIIPKYNKQDKRNDTLTIQLEEKEWKLYKGLKRQIKRYEAEGGILTWILIAALIVAIIQILLGGRVWMKS